MPYKDPKIIGKIAEIPAVLKENGKTHPLVVTGKSARESGRTLSLERALQSAGIEYSVYDGVVANPTTENAEEAVRLYLGEGCDSLIGFGGGSPMDCAKCAGALVARPDKTLSELGGILKVKKKIPLLIAVPTTAGTGSEATLAAVVVDGATRRKYAINDFPLIPSYAVLDAEACAKLPKRLVATTGMDALTHAVEAYIGRGGNASARKDALEAIKLVFENIEAFYAGNREAGEKMLIASHKAGRAFSKAYVGNVHALAHPLGGKYDVPHGLANAVLLPVVLREYGKTVYKKLWKIAVFCGLVGAEAEYGQGAEALITKIEGLNDAFGIERSFPQIRRADIAVMADRAEREANPLYPVPVVWSKNKFREIYEKICAEGKAEGEAENE